MIFDVNVLCVFEMLIWLLRFFKQKKIRKQKIYIFKIEYTFLDGGQYIFYLSFKFDKVDIYKPGLYFLDIPK